MIPADIRAFFDGYARAFTAQDAAAICAHYAFPVQILSEASGHVFRTEAEMLAEMTGFVAFYDKVDFAQAQIAGFAFQELSPAFGQAHVDWRLIDKAGAEIVRFNTTYTLRLGDAAPAITGILGHSEDSAWQQRGVPIDW
jgi:ketosteroid isomerase-like protein